MSDDDRFSAPPGPPAPGIIPGATPPPHAAAPAERVTLSPTGQPLEKPSGVARALVGVTAAYTVLQVALAAFAQEDAERTRETLETGELSLGLSTVASLLALPLLAASLVAYGLWMGRMRANRQALGERPGLPAVEWWGWFVPLASAVLVPLGARRVTGRAVSLGLMLGWWLPWIAAQLLSGGSSIAINLSIDLRTGELVRPELLDLYAPFVWGTAAATVVSWFFLFRFIREATDRHLER